GQTMTGQMRYLRARPERELPLARAPLGDSPPPLERCRRLAIRAERALDHHGGFRQCLLHLAALDAARAEVIVRRAGGAERGRPRIPSRPISPPAPRATAPTPGHAVAAPVSTPRIRA